MLIAYTDIGPDDGATMVIPGSHKSNMIHPQFLGPRNRSPWEEGQGGSVEGIAGAIEVHMQAGDALVFVDAISHGSARRTNPGERRISVYRYGSAWNRTRWGYEPSPGLLERLDPLSRSIVAPERNAHRREPGSAAGP